MCRIQQAISECKNISQRGSLKNNQYQLPTRGNIGSQNLHESDGVLSGQKPPTGQQHYPSDPLRTHGGPYDTPGGGDGDPPTDTYISKYKGGLDSSSSKLDK